MRSVPWATRVALQRPARISRKHRPLKRSIVESETLMSHFTSLSATWSFDVSSFSVTWSESRDRGGSVSRGEDMSFDEVARVGAQRQSIDMQTSQVSTHGAAAQLQQRRRSSPSPARQQTTLRLLTTDVQLPPPCIRQKTHTTNF